MALRVFITQPIGKTALERLRRFAQVEVNPDSSKIIDKQRLLTEVRRHDILFSLLHDRVDEEVIAVNPGLRAITSMAITPDNIDVPAATARRVPVTVIPAIVHEATADMTFALMFAVALRLVEGDRFVRTGGFPGSQSNHLAGGWVSGKVLGLVGGGGRIGRGVARRAKGFGMRVLYWGPRRLPEEEERALGMIYTPLDRLLAEADFVSIHSPMRPETRHQIGARELALMKSTAYLINTARGPIVDEEELVRVLREGRIAGAGLDVFEHEPRVSPALLTMPNVVLTPHLGTAVLELRDAMANIVVDNILAIFEGRRPPNCVNPEVFGD
jgi:glyoxylate reductase